tara:strand:+ start:842 stop:1030 length:189 start_codon:yes stop_codon:yes gene_type:complete
MKINKREQAIPLPQYETVTTYELTQEEMSVLINAIGRLRPNQGQEASDFFFKYATVVRGNQP